MKKRIIKAVSIMLVVVIFMLMLTSCGKISYISSAKNILDKDKGAYNITCNIDTQELKGEIIIDGKFKRVDKNTYSTGKISYKFNPVFKAKKITDFIVNESGIYFDAYSLINFYNKEIGLTSYSTLISLINNIFKRGTYAFVSIETIDELIVKYTSVENINVKDIINSFYDAFADDIDNILWNANVISESQNVVSVKINNNNTINLLKVLKEYLKEDFRSSLNDVEEKLSDNFPIKNAIQISDIKIKSAICVLNDVIESFETKKNSMPQYSFVSTIDKSKNIVSFCINSEKEKTNVNLNLKLNVIEKEINEKDFISPINIVDISNYLTGGLEKDVMQLSENQF